MKWWAIWPQATVENSISVDEYLFSSEKEGYRWLSEYRGHWNFMGPPLRMLRCRRHA